MRSHHYNNVGRSSHLLKKEKNDGFERKRGCQFNVHRLL